MCANRSCCLGHASHWSVSWRKGFHPPPIPAGLQSSFSTLASCIGLGQPHARRLARRLAALGYAAVRFDLSGSGDSERRPDVLNLLDAALVDIRETLDSLESSIQLRRAILVGLC